MIWGQQLCSLDSMIYQYLFHGIVFRISPGTLEMLFFFRTHNNACCLLFIYQARPTKHDQGYNPRTEEKFPQDTQGTTELQDTPVWGVIAPTPRRSQCRWTDGQAPATSGGTNGMGENLSFSFPTSHLQGSLRGVHEATVLLPLPILATGKNIR